MNQQIRHCSFNVTTSDGVNTTAINGFPVNVSITDGAYVYRPYYYTGRPFDEALNGTLRSQLGGYRFEASLQWARPSDAANIALVINNAKTNTANIVEVVFYPDATNTAVSEVVVIDDVVWDNRIERTIRRMPVAMSIRGKSVKDTLPDYYV